ncbi:hypothetical protein L1987_40251 [Smallanthus sonchifolius]|uniref:Uncharacterized protein n=1 Tax=Smallanthus sonchifolius TaxID=185202 RepID=A0ACB9GTW1_9ASTR|nr:hypothetical protein L1987_40251 [Smallanthus sonchifolius]
MHGMAVLKLIQESDNINLRGRLLGLYCFISSSGDSPATIRLNKSSSGRLSLFRATLERKFTLRSTLKSPVDCPAHSNIREKFNWAAELWYTGPTIAIVAGIVETGDSSADVSKTVKADNVREVDNITAGLGFSNKDLINSDISQTADCRPTSHVSNNYFDQIVHDAKDFIPIKFMKEGSSDIASHSVLYPANLSNDKVNNILDQQGSARNNFLNDQKKNYSSRSPYVKPVSHNSKTKTKKDSPRNSSDRLPGLPYHIDCVSKRLKYSLDCTLSMNPVLSSRGRLLGLEIETEAHQIEDHSMHGMAVLKLIQESDNINLMGRLLGLYW